MTQLLSFHNDPSVKRKYVNRVKSHAAKDRIRQGIGWDGGKGCAVGCTLEAYDHNRYPIELGIPVILARLEDRIFEGLAPSEAMKWPARFLSAIPVGKDLSEVWPKFAIWLLRDVRKFARPDGKRAIDGVVAFYRLPMAGRTEGKRKAMRAEASYAAEASYDAATAAEASYDAANAAAYAASSYASAASYAAATAASAAEASYAEASYASYAAATAATAASYAAASYASYAAAAYAAATAATAASYAAASYAVAAATAASASGRQHYKLQASKLLELLGAA